jgi:RHS repeat-associated protein
MQGTVPASSFSCSARRQERRQESPVCARPGRHPSRRAFRKTCFSKKRAHLSGNTPLVANSRTTHLGPFGEVIRATAPMAKLNPLRFSTKFQDDESDLIYYGYRYYSASLGRWLNRDPIQEAGNLNMYLFSHNSCLGKIDGLGLLDIDIQDPDAFDGGDRLPGRGKSVGLVTIDIIGDQLCRATAPGTVKMNVTITTKFGNGNPSSMLQIINQIVAGVNFSGSQPSTDYPGAITYTGQGVLETSQCPDGKQEHSGQFVIGDPAGRVAVMLSIDWAYEYWCDNKTPPCGCKSKKPFRSTFGKPYQGLIGGTQSPPPPPPRPPRLPY